MVAQHLRKVKIGKSDKKTSARKYLQVLLQNHYK